MLSEDELYTTYKIILCGDSGVGKTSLISKYINGTNLPPSTIPTIAVELNTKLIHLSPQTKVKAQIWDTAGQEKYQAISSNFFKRAQGVLLVFDITNYQTFQSVKTWLEKITTYTREDCVILLVGNKSDLENTRKVPCDKAFKFAKENGIFKYREVSIYNENDVNDCIDKVFVELVREIYKTNSNDVLYPNAQGKANSLTNSQRVTFATKNFNYVNHGTVNEATSFYCC